MAGLDPTARAPRQLTPPQVLFAVIMIAYGLHGFVTHDFSVLWQPVPDGIPGRTFLVDLCAAVALVGGVGLLWRRSALFAARLLCVMLLAWLLLLRLPYIAFSPHVDATWSTGEVAIFLSAAWVILAWSSGPPGWGLAGRITGPEGHRIALILYGLGLVPFGAAHFLYVPQTTVLIPHWLPWPDAWAYFTGGAFIVAGLAVVLRRFARLAVILSSLQIALFTLIIWVPVVFREGATPGQWREFTSSAALAIAGWVVAESCRDEAPGT